MGQPSAPVPKSPGGSRPSARAPARSGGVLEFGESPQDGVIREVYEETGVKIRPVRLTGVYKNMRLGVVSLAFKCAGRGRGAPLAGGGPRSLAVPLGGSRMDARGPRRGHN